MSLEHALFPSVLNNDEAQGDISKNAVNRQSFRIIHLRLTDSLD
jgi:hypothetical protein